MFILEIALGIVLAYFIVVSIVPLLLIGIILFFCLIGILLLYLIYANWIMLLPLIIFFVFLGFFAFVFESKRAIEKIDLIILGKNIEHRKEMGYSTVELEKKYIELDNKIKFKRQIIENEKMIAFKKKLGYDTKELENKFKK